MHLGGVSEVKDNGIQIDDVQRDGHRNQIYLDAIKQYIRLTVSSEAIIESLRESIGTPTLEGMMFLRTS